MATRTTKYMWLDELESAPRNAKAHDEELIGASIDRFGLVEIITLDERTGKIISGHGRRDDLVKKHAGGESAPEDVRVVKGRWQVPVSRGWSSADDDEALAAGIALNQVGVKGGWEFGSLVEDLDTIAASDFGLDAIGFGADDLDRMKAALALAANTPDDEPAAVVKGPPENPRTKKGDVWELGPHRLICGDCRDPRTVKKLLAGAQINLAFTSPPYAEQREYDESSGFRPIPPDEYVDWFAAVAANVEAHLADDGSWFVNIKPPGVDLDTDLYVLDLVIAHVRAWGWHFVTEFCWERNGVPKQVTHRFKNQFEPVYQFARGIFKMRPDAVRHATANAIVPLGPGSGVDTNWKNKQGDAGVIPQHDRKNKLPRGDIANFQGGTGEGAKRGGDKSVLRMSKKEGTTEPAPRANPRSHRDPNTGTMSKMQGVPGGPNVGSRKRARGTKEVMSDVQGTAYDAGEAIGVGWAYPGNRLPTFSSSHTAVGHAAAFPVGLPAWFVRAYTDEGDTVFDPFMGSGSSILAAHQENRIGYGVELSPGYCDVICRRFQEVTGIKPRRAGTRRGTDFLVPPPA